MSKEPIEFLKHIADECTYLLSVNKGLSKDDFLDDETLKRAVVRSLEIIGEATKKIPADYKVKWNSIQWKNMAGMRDRLIHDYIGSTIQLFGMFLTIKSLNSITKFTTY